MKARTTLAAVVAASFLAFPAFAAPPAGKAPAGAHAKGKRAGKGDPAKREARVLARLKQAGIDDARAKKVIAIHERYQAEQVKLRNAAKPDREAFKNARKSKDAAALEVAKAKMQAHRAKRKALNAKREKEVLTVLTPTEVAKLKAMRQNARGNKKGHRGHGGKAKSKQS